MCTTEGATEEGAQLGSKQTPLGSPSNLFIRRWLVFGRRTYGTASETPSPPLTGGALYGSGSLLPAWGCVCVCVCVCVCACVCDRGWSHSVILTLGGD